MEAILTWVEEEEVPKARKGKGARETGLWAKIMAELRANPGKWAVICESLDAAKLTALRYRFPDIDFRGAIVARGKGITTQTKVWACYHEKDGAQDEDAPVQIALTVTQIQDLVGRLVRV